MVLIERFVKPKPFLGRCWPTWWYRLQPRVRHHTSVPCCSSCYWALAFPASRAFGGMSKRLKIFYSEWSQPWHFKTYVLTYILTFYLTFYLASILAFYLPSFLAFYLASILAFFLAFYLTFFLIFYLTYIFCIFFGIQSDIYSDILADIHSDILIILSDIYSDILFCILSDIYSDRLSDIYSDILSGRSSDIFSAFLSDIHSYGSLWSRSGRDHCDLVLWSSACCSGPAGTTVIGLWSIVLAVRVRQGPLWSSACRSGPEGTTLIRGLLFGSGRDHSDPGLADHCDLALAVEFWQAWCDPGLAVRVRRGPLRSRACCSGPAGEAEEGGVELT